MLLVKVIKSRYGDERLVEDLGAGWFSLSGKSRFLRGGMDEFNELNYLDPEGGPFVQIGDDLGLGEIVRLETAANSPSGTFKIRFETER